MGTAYTGGAPYGAGCAAYATACAYAEFSGIGVAEAVGVVRAADMEANNDILLVFADTSVDTCTGEPAKAVTLDGITEAGLLVFHHFSKSPCNDFLEASKSCFK